MVLLDAHTEIFYPIVPTARPQHVDLVSYMPPFYISMQLGSVGSSSSLSSPRGHDGPRRSATLTMPRWLERHRNSVVEPDHLPSAAHPDAHAIPDNSVASTTEDVSVDDAVGGAASELRKHVGRPEGPEGGSKLAKLGRSYFNVQPTSYADRWQVALERQQLPWHLLWRPAPLRMR